MFLFLDFFYNMNLLEELKFLTVKHLNLSKVVSKRIIQEIFVNNSTKSPYLIQNLKDY